MITKLTLTLNHEVIEAAKAYAKKNGKSLSAIVETYLQADFSVRYRKATHQIFAPLLCIRKYHFDEFTSTRNMGNQFAQKAATSTPKGSNVLE